MARGWEVVKIYQEKASATGRVERSQYTRLLEDARRPGRPWNHLLVWSLDRWSREERFTRAITAIEDLESAGVLFHSLKEPMLDSVRDDTPSIGRELLRAILPVIAAFESRRRSDRVRVAMREIKEGRRRTKSGLPPGRPRRLDDHRVHQIVEFRRSGMAWKAVAQHVGLPAGTCAAAYSLYVRGLWKPATLEKVLS